VRDGNGEWRFEGNGTRWVGVKGGVRGAGRVVGYSAMRCKSVQVFVIDLADFITPLGLRFQPVALPSSPPP